MRFDNLIAVHGAELSRLLNDPAQRLALAAAVVAAALILVSALVKTIIPLRWLAVGSNLGFVCYGLVHPAPMVMLLHAALLPINLWRVLEMHRLTRRVRRAGTAAPQVWLQPFMKRRRLRASQVLFRRGDSADRLYVLAEGRLEIVESGRAIEPGQMFGEIAFFSPDRRRTGSVRAVARSTVLSIDETTFRQLFYQDPGFGFEIVSLIAERLSADVRRGEERSAPPSRPDAPASQGSAAASG